MSAPNSYSRRVLVAACGMTPQVVTETLYALRVAADEPFLVNEIRLITTSEGARQAELSLLREGHFHRFCEEYGIADLRFDVAHIETIRDAQGAALSDIRTPEQNRAAADCITDLLRRLTREADTSLHVSLAGGRKTMGYYIGYALSLFGRAQDRLSHVLVSEGFETNREFFYPTRTSRVIASGARYLDAAEAEVTLAEIPFVRLRDNLPERLLAERTSFSEAVRWSNLDKEPVRAEIDLQQRRLRVSGEVVDLSLKDLAFYAVFARAAQEREPDIEATDPAPNRQLTRAFAEEFARCHGIEEPDALELAALLDRLQDVDVDQRTIDTLRKGIGKRYMEPVISTIKGKLESAVGERLTEHYRIQVRARLRKNDKTVPLYGIGLEARQIVLSD